MTDPRLDDEEMIDILEQIAREGTNAAARIAAIKQLREMREDPSPKGSPLDSLYRTNPGRRKRAHA